MIQELLGTPNLLGGERKILPFNGGIILEGTPNPPLHPNLASPWAPPSSAASVVPDNGVEPATDAPPITKNHSSNPSNSCSENNNLRCPRCDSSNTKFCYYNNYNLTQPRHFCKTCRRYWTKGGALRNVPIGGGCRKNRPMATTSTAGIGSVSSKPGGSKFQTLVSELGRPGLVPGFDHDNIIPPPPIPVFLATAPHNSHILSLLKGSQSPNPNYGDPLPAPVFLPFKEDTNLLGSGPIQEPPMSVHSSVLVHHHNYHHQQQNCAIITGGEISRSGVQSLFQKLGAPTGDNYYAENNINSITLGIHCNTNSQLLSSRILESVPATSTSELGYWNPTFCMPDLPTTNGAYP